VEALFGFELAGGFSCGNIRWVNMVAMSPHWHPEGDPPPVYGNPLNWARYFNKKSTLWRLGYDFNMDCSMRLLTSSIRIVFCRFGLVFIKFVYRVSVGFIKFQFLG
jgi:hypothetical protein